MKINHKGFTVVEMLVTLAMFAIMIPAISLGIGSLISINNRARDLTLVSILAENKIESLRSVGYNSVPVGTTSFSSELSNELASPKSATYVITQQTGYRTIDVNITYTDNKRSRSTNYRSIISETGVGQ